MTGSVLFGFEPGGGGMISVDTAGFSFAAAGGLTVFVTVLPSLSMYCTCCGTCVANAWAFALSSAFWSLLAHPATSTSAIMTAAANALRLVSLRAIELSCHVSQTVCECRGQAGSPHS
jgi:hypothetical protein